MARRKKGVSAKITGCSKPNIPVLKLEHPNYHTEYLNAQFYLRTLVSCKELKKETMRWVQENKNFLPTSLLLKC